MLYLLFHYPALSRWNTWRSPFSAAIKVWWQAGGEGEKAPPDTILLTELCSGAHCDLLSTAPWSWPPRALCKFWAAKGYFYNPQETSSLCLQQLPHQKSQEKGGTTLGHCIYYYKFSSYFPLLRGGGKGGSLRPIPPSSVTSAQIWKEGQSVRGGGGRNSIREHCSG